MVCTVTAVSLFPMLSALWPVRGIDWVSFSVGSFCRCEFNWRGSEIVLMSFGLATCVRMAGVC